MKKHFLISYFTGSAALFLTAVLLFSSCSVGLAQSGFQRTGFAMGSVINARVFCPDETEANDITDAVFAAAAGLDSLISATDEGTEIAVLNAEGNNTLSEQTADLLRKSLILCRASDGKLDITLGAVTGLWGFSTDDPCVPDENELLEALSTVGSDNVVFDGNDVTLLNGAKIDLGAVGKGAAGDEALSALAKYGRPAVISFGGTVMLYKDKPGSDGWGVGIRDPYMGQDDYCATLTLSPGDGAYFISTSGSYEKNFTEDGATYHHIIDPSTGYPVQTDLVSVTAVSEYGYMSDALSTALFAGGLNDRSLFLIERYLLGAVFIFDDGRIYVSDALRDAFKLTNTEFYSLINYEDVS